ncbi:MAG TPA: glutamate synthase subunit beta [Candidatus Omnitrophota bacterium]|nr:glutamate synthase subunit beta [Candidatus Omnitrophota bacterium]
MGKPEGFLEYQRALGAKRPVAERLKDYKEIPQRLSPEDLKKQGARCMDCGIPYCHAIGCPVYNLIPEWNDAVYRGQWRDAYERLSLTNNLPEVTGRVCPAPCEAACTLSINSAPVTIEQIELAIVERAFAEGWVKPQPPQTETAKRVAVIGSGPAGLTSAQQLRRRGHQVTLFEKSAKAGGILRYGIPDFKLEKWVLDRRIEQMKAEGVKFEMNVNAGETVTAAQLKKDFDAILLTMGAGEPRDLKIPGRELPGVHFAMEFLTLSNRRVSGEASAAPAISAKGKTVLVIGGGDTGSDCVGTSNRQGAKKVYQYEILPKPREWKEPWNPVWPNWPQILRNSTSHEEGCERDWAITTKRFTARDGNVHEAHCARVEWSLDKTTGQYSMKEIPGAEFVLQADLVLLAMGFVHVEHSKLFTDLGVQFDARGNVLTNGNFLSSAPGVFAAGDTVRGASLVVWAISQGRQAAQAVDVFLKS